MLSWLVLVPPVFLKRMCDLVYHYSLTYEFGKVMLLNGTFLTLLLYEQILIIISYSRLAKFSNATRGCHRGPLLETLDAVEKSKMHK